MKKITSLRGVDSTAVIRTLTRRNLIANAGMDRQEVLWITTPLFLEVFGRSKVGDVLEDVVLARVLAED